MVRTRPVFAQTVTIMLYVTMINYNRQLKQHENQLDSLLAENFLFRDYVTHSQGTRLS